MRRLLLAAVPAASVALAACTGSTQPATKVTNVSAQLNARGYTDDGPATWWWEYDSVRSDLGTANDTEICGSPPEPDRRCGPASGGSQSNQIPLSVTVTGLDARHHLLLPRLRPGLNDTQPTCANVHSFRTLAGTRYALDRTWGSSRQRRRAVLRARVRRDGRAGQRLRRATAATTGCRSSPPPGASSPSGAATERATGSSPTRARGAWPPTPRATSTSPTTAAPSRPSTSASRSSARPGASSPRGAPTAAVTPSSWGPRASRPIARAASTWRTTRSTASTSTASRSTAPPVPSSRSGAASASATGSSGSPTAWPRTPPATSTSPTAATPASRSSPPRAPSSRSGAAREPAPAPSSPRAAWPRTPPAASSSADSRQRQPAEVHLRRRLRHDVGRQRFGRRPVQRSLRRRHRRRRQRLRRRRRQPPHPEVHADRVSSRYAAEPAAELRGQLAHVLEAQARRRTEGQRMDLGAGAGPQAPQL